MLSVGPSELAVQVCIPVESVLGEGIHSFIQQTTKDCLYKVQVTQPPNKCQMCVTGLVNKWVCNKWCRVFMCVCVPAHARV